MAKQRSDGEGEVRRRADGRYEARLRIDGSRHSVYGATRAEVVAKLDSMRDRVADGSPPLDARTTVAEWADHWSSTSLAASERRPTTMATYRRHLRNHIVPHLGQRRLDQLRPSHIEAMLLALRRAGKGDHLRRSVFTVLSLLLDGAVRDGLIANNPTKRVDRPRVAHRDAKWWTPDEVVRLLAAAEGDRHWPLLFLLARTGLRRGEALALRWEHVHLDAHPPVLLVRGTLSRVDGGGLVVTPPKSARSRRRLPLDAVLVETLRAHATEQKRERLRTGPRWQDTGFVFTTDIGTPEDPRNVSRWAKQTIGSAGLDGSLHTLRHSAASTLVAEGVHLRIVAEILGHASTRLTADTYAHVAPDILSDAMQLAANALDRHC